MNSRTLVFVLLGGVLVWLLYKRFGTAVQYAALPPAQNPNGGNQSATPMTLFTSLLEAFTAGTKMVTAQTAPQKN